MFCVIFFIFFLRFLCTSQCFLLWFTPDVINLTSYLIPTFCPIMGHTLGRDSLDRVILRLSRLSTSHSLSCFTHFVFFHLYVLFQENLCQTWNNPTVAGGEIPPRPPPAPALTPLLYPNANLFYYFLCSTTTAVLAPASGGRLLRIYRVVDLFLVIYPIWSLTCYPNA